MAAAGHLRIAFAGHAVKGDGKMYFAKLDHWMTKGDALPCVQLVAQVCVVADRPDGMENEEGCVLASVQCVAVGRATAAVCGSGIVNVCGAGPGWVKAVAGIVIHCCSSV